MLLNWIVSWMFILYIFALFILYILTRNKKAKLFFCLICSTAATSSSPYQCPIKLAVTNILLGRWCNVTSREPLYSLKYKYIRFRQRQNDHNSFDPSEFKTLNNLPMKKQTCFLLGKWFPFGMLYPFLEYCFHFVRSLSSPSKASYEIETKHEQRLKAISYTTHLSGLWNWDLYNILSLPYSP